MASEYRRKERLHYLDSMRGIAACMVLFGHFIEWRWLDLTWVKVTGVFISPHAAVSFFFVLSGFVLSYRLLHSDTKIDILNYSIRRALRLYPAYLFTVLFIFFFLHRDPLMDGNFQEVFFKEGKMLKLFRELLMVRVEHGYYVPGWTLGVEMTVSLLIPFIVMAARNNIRMVWALPLIVMFMGAYISDFVFHFTLGVLVAWYYPTLRSDDFRSKKIYRRRYQFLLPAIVLFLAIPLERVFAPGENYAIVKGIVQLKPHYFTAAASAFLIAFAIVDNRWQRFLNNRVLRFIGEISYGIYLAHWLWVLWFMQHFNKYERMFGGTITAGIAVFFIIVVLTLANSMFIYYVIEKPLNKIGRRFKYIISKEE